MTLACEIHQFHCQLWYGTQRMAVGFTNSIPHKIIDNANSQIPKFALGTAWSKPTHVQKTLDTRFEGSSIAFLQNESYPFNNAYNFFNINHNYTYFQTIGI